MLLDSRYRLGPRLGQGGMADVYEAWDTHLERQVAIKRYRAAPYGIGLRRFMAEAELLGGLSHPGLLTVFDVGFDGERPYLVLRLATGGTLRDRIDTRPLPPARTAKLGAAIAEALAYVHANGIVHRDVKPSNILFGVDSDCYLADFGIARAMDAERITGSNEFVGTAAYLAPEQVAGDAPGPPADVYALGLVLLECLTGRPEYEGTGVEVALARLSRQPRIPDTWGSEWHTMLSAMTATNPTDRPDAPRCVTLLQALEAGRTLPMPVPARRAPRIYAGLATTAAAAAVLVALTVEPTQLAGRPTADPTQIVRDEPQPTPPAEVPPAETPPAPAPPATEPTTTQPPDQTDNSGKGPKSKSNKGKGKSGKG